MFFLEELFKKEPEVLYYKKGVAELFSAAPFAYI